MSANGVYAGGDYRPVIFYLDHFRVATVNAKPRCSFQSEKYPDWNTEGKVRLQASNFDQEADPNAASTLFTDALILSGISSFYNGPPKQ